MKWLTERFFGGEFFILTFLPVSRSSKVALGTVGNVLVGEGLRRL